MVARKKEKVVIQASDGGRVYVGKSALETKLRETPIASAYGNDEPTPTPVVALSTERMVFDAPIEQPAANAGRAEPVAPVVEEQIARHGWLTKSTMVGLCLSAFACGIITTVMFDHQHLRALERQVHAQAEALATATRAPAPAEPAPAAAPAKAAPAEPAPPPPAEPIVEQLPPAPTASAAAMPAAPVQAAVTAAPAADKLGEAAPLPQKAPGPRLTAARTPRPPAPRAAVRRRSTPPAESGGADEPAATPWVDPFAE